MTGKVVYKGGETVVFATSAPEAVLREGYAVWADDNGYTYGEVGKEDESPFTIVVDEPFAPRLAVGIKLTKFRESNGISLETFSELTGIRWQNLVRIEQGRYCPSLDKFTEMISAIGATIDIV